MEKKTVIEAIGICKSFQGPTEVKVLSDVSFAIYSSEFVSVVGKSGCGKSTLLYILSTMDTNYEGDLMLDGVSMKNKKDAILAKVRNEKIGFVFQFHYLINEFNNLRNVMLPALKMGKFTSEEIEAHAYAKLKMLGIEKEALKFPNQLSGGQKQRVAIARALINEPLIIMGDEPTGNLDKKNSDIVFDIFKELVETYKQSLLIVTHDLDFAAKTQRTITMEDGQLTHTIH
jgi:lipoprotein-releasing system ATP-binding protein